ncbi:MAG TPA: DinB family protein [Thermoanaerobaculia bacterium]|nr:DinB family protein [Thermoanaerobaculia bacterium]
MTHLRRTALAAVCALLPWAAAAQQDTATKPNTAAPAAESKLEMAKPAGVRGDILAQIQDAETKLIALAEATPADKFGWRPADGVRTIGEVYAHVAGGNYFLPTFWDVKAPEGVDPRSFEPAAGDKAGTIDRMRKSFEHARGAIARASDADLERAVKMFGQQSTVRGAMMTVATHAHEHLGQAIAYARSNGIVPPWSRGGN